MNYEKQIRSLSPCTEGLKFAESVNFNLEAIYNCNRGDWLLWLAAKLNIDRRLIVLVACDCSEQTLKYVPAGEERPRVAIETARAWCAGKATLDEVRSAADAAHDADAIYATYGSYGAALAAAAAYAAALSLAAGDTYTPHHAASAAARAADGAAADLFRARISLEMIEAKLTEV